jgi:predicted tellurium resistance membrane protein TerC
MEIVFALVALTAMEIVLGIDNVVFIAILAGRLPKEQQAKARNIGLGAALVMRLLLLAALKVILGATEPIFHLSDFLPQAWFSPNVLPGAEVELPEGAHHTGVAVNAVSWRDIILLVGGLFLIGKSVLEIHHKIEGHEAERKAAAASFAGVIVQIALLDIVFSLDSVITAIGMVAPDKLWIMVVAIIISIGVMLVFAGKISTYIEQHPTLKILALSFLILIGVLLVAEGIGTHFNKGYIYFAMAFALAVEVLNMRIRKGAGALPTGTPAT